MLKEKKKYVIGVDGGGTKTIAALADLRGRILKVGKSGPSNPRNVGTKKASENIAQAIKKVLKKRKANKILSTFIGLAGVEEEYKGKKREITKELFREKGISPVFKGKLIIGSDQIVAFRSGTNEKEGVMLIAGTGCVAHGWRQKREAKCSGWGWLVDEGAAFWVGQKVFQAVFKALDGRGSKTLLTKIVFKELKTEFPFMEAKGKKSAKKSFSSFVSSLTRRTKFSSPVKTKEDLIEKIYSKNPTEIIPLFSVFCDTAAKRGDKVAQKILLEAARELALSVKTVIKKLDFKRQKFPVVLVGGMFKSKIVFKAIKKEIKRFAPKVKFIQPKKNPVVGAVKLAIDEIE